MQRGNMLTRDEIYHSISSIPDPEIPVITIDELGILRDVRISGNSVEVDITPTYSGCPAMQAIEDDIKGMLHGKGIEMVHINTVYSPAWTTDWMAASAKEKLRSYGIAPPGMTTLVQLDATVAQAVQPATLEEVIICPLCGSQKLKLISQFSSTACKALYQCLDCKEPFDYFKPH